MLDHRRNRITQDEARKRRGNAPRSRHGLGIGKAVNAEDDGIGYGLPVEALSDGGNSRLRLLLLCRHPSLRLVGLHGVGRLQTTEMEASNRSTATRRPRMPCPSSFPPATPTA